MGSLACLPSPRGPLTEYLFSALSTPRFGLPDPPVPIDDPLSGDDFHLALYACYELHYQGFEGVDSGWEWEPSLLSLRRRLEIAFEGALREAVTAPVFESGVSMADQLADIEASDDGPSLSRYMQGRATLDQYREFVVHRSAYHLKEADPHTWAIPRVRGAAKAAMVEIQYDEYGSGRAGRTHAELFAAAMEALELDSSYGAYLDVVPGVTLATVNLMSLFGLHRRLRGASVGHLALFEMTSPTPNRRYAAGLRRLGYSGGAVEFFDEHVEADAVHEVIAANDMAGGLAAQEPEVADDVLFGAAALLFLDIRFARHVLAAWEHGRSSLLAPAAVVVT